MLDRKLQSWFYPAPTGDVGRDRNARTLQFTCLLFAFAIALVAFLDTIARERVALPILVMAVVALVAAAAINRAGMSAWAARIAIVAVLLTAILLVLEARDGFRSHAMLVFPGLLLISMTLLDRKSYVTTAVIVLLAVAALAIAETHGLTGAIPGIRTPTSYDSIFYVDLTLAVFAMIGSRIASDAQRNVFDLRASVEQLSVANLELTKAAEALRRSESQARAQAAELQAIMDAAPAVILVANDSECRHVGGNQTAYALMRQKRGTNLSMAAPDGERPTNRRVMQNGIEIPLNEMPLHKAAFTGQPIRNYDLEVVFEDGTSIDLLGNVEPIPDEKGVPRGVVAVLSDITQRKQAETALRDSEERFRVTFSQAAVGIAQTGLDGKWLLLNDRLCEILGYTQAELCGKNFLEITHPDDREASLAAVRQLLAGEISSWSAEKRYGRKDGAIVWARLCVSLVRNQDNRPQYFIAVVEDVTERVQADRALRDSERRLALAQTAARLGVWERDLRTDTIAISGEYTSLYGLPPDRSQITHQEWLSLVHPDDRERMEALLRENRERPGDWDVEFRVVWPDRSLHWLLGKGTVLFDDFGQPVHRVGVHLDITERKRAEVALHESEELFRNVANTAPVMIWVLGPDKCMTFVNKAWLDFAGRPVEQELGNGWLEGVHPDDRKRSSASFSSAFNARQEFHIEGRLRRADGEYRWVLCTGVPRFKADGAFDGYIGSTIDVTDQKYSEAERRRSLDEIAHLNRVAAMAELTASLAHELNQPLAAILLNSQAASRFLNGQPPNLARVSDCLNRIAADGERAGAVIKRLRGLLKKGESQASSVDLNEVVSDAIRLVGNDALLRQVSVKFEPLPGLPPVLGDRIQLYQVALHLIMNGLDAAAERPPGNRWVLVRTAEGDGGRVELTVEDSGKGIAESEIARVFELFFSTKREGLGMGLSISRSIVQAHGGQVWVENSARHGAIFHCMLPVAQQGAAAATL